jgi:hypothetical protein
MEVQVLCYRATATLTTGAAAAEPLLINLLRGLFRLQEVERLALADINTRTGSQPRHYEHALEISLAYRVGLAERLDLPSQPRAVASRWNVEVTPAMLERAYQKILTTERTSALLDWLVTQRFWVEYLEASHQEQFLAISERSVRALTQLDGQIELSREAAAGRMTAIFDNFKNERRALMRQLTSTALVRHPAPVHAAPGTSASGRTPQ